MKNLILKLTQNQFFHALFLNYYKLAIGSVNRKLRKFDFIDEIFIKGSYQKNYFVPGISDLDFFIIGDANEENKRIIAKIFKKLNFFYPIVKDYDFHSEETFRLLSQYGGLKYIDVHEWIPLKGEKKNFSYRYNPRKFSVDIIHEIYFQLEWLFRNIKKRKVGDSYRTQQIFRQYNKVIDLLNYASEFENVKFYISHRNVSFNKRWLTYSNQYILLLFNELLSSNDFITVNKEVLFAEFEERDFSQTLKERFFQEKVFVLNQNQENFDTGDKEIFLSESNLKLFYYCGSIDSYLLYEQTQTRDSLISSMYLELLYYTRLLERRWNTRHDSYFYSQNFDRSKKLMFEIESKIRFEKYAPYSYLGKNVLIVPAQLPRPELIAEIRSSVPVNIEVLFVSLSENELLFEEDGFTLLNLFEQNEKNQIDQSIPLINIGIDWAFGANIIAVGSLNKIISDTFYWENLFNLVNKSTFVEAYELEGDGFCWFGKAKDWGTVIPFSQTENSGELQNLIKYQLTGYIPSDSKINLKNTKLNMKVKFYDVFYENVSFKIIHNINHRFSGFISKRKGALYQFIQSWLQTDKLGLNRVIEGNKQNWEDLISLYSTVNENPYLKLEILNSFIDKMKNQRIATSFSDLSVSDSPYWNLYGSAVIISEGENHMTFRTSSFHKNNVTLAFNDRIGENSDLLGVLYKFTFKTKITEEKISAKKQNQNVVLNWAGQELYDINLFIQNNRFFYPNNYKIEMQLRPDTTYSFILNNKIPIEPISDEDCIVFKNLSFGKYEDILRLGEFVEGLYKIVIYTTKPVTGDFYISLRNMSKRFETFSAKGESVFVMYFYNDTYHSDLILNSNIVQGEDFFGIKLDVLKYNKLIV